MAQISHLYVVGECVRDLAHELGRVRLATEIRWQICESWDMGSQLALRGRAAHAP